MGRRQRRLVRPDRLEGVLDAGSKAFARGRNYQYVPTIVGDARAARNGLTVTADPKPGDLVCFDWDGSNFATGNNHVGMFVSGTASNFKTIEGNVSSCCAEHDRTAASAPPSSSSTLSK